VRQLAIEQSDVLNQIALIGMANDFDYLVFEKKGASVVVRRKRLDELTREQMVAIEVMGGQSTKANALQYKFRDRDGKLFELGKAMGLFNEKILLEHRHSHLHLSADLSKVPMSELEAIEAQFERLLTQEGPTDATPERVPPVRGDQGANGGGGETPGSGEDLGREDHKLTRRRRPP